VSDMLRSRETARAEVQTSVLASEIQSVDITKRTLSASPHHVGSAILTHDVSLYYRWTCVHTSMM